MTDIASSSPYHTPVNISERRLTPKGCSPGQCCRRFFLLGLVVGWAGGQVLFILNALQMPIPTQMLPVGLSFGLSFWVANGLFIGTLSMVRNLILIFGCLASFGVCGIVAVQLTTSGWMMPQPTTWQFLRPYVMAPATSALLIAGIVRWVGGKVSWQVIFSVWAFISFFGFAAYFAVDELGMRRRIVNEPTLAFICGTGFLAITLGLIGWQLGEAHAELTVPDGGSREESATNPE